MNYQASHSPTGLAFPWQELLLKLNRAIPKVSRLTCVVFWLSAVLVLCPSILWAQLNRNQFNLLLLPSSIEARSKLKQSCQLSNEKPLKSILVDIYQAYHLPFWVDRRVDLMQPAVLTRSDNSYTLGQELVRLATSCGLQGGFVENIYVMAPANRLARIQRSAVVLHGQLATKFKSIANTTKGFQWPDITSSNELLQLIADSWNIEVASTELPHDLYHEGNLPNCTLATQLALLLSGFDLQANLDPNSTDRVKLNIEPLASVTAWEDSYQRSVTEVTISDLRSRYPSGSLEVVRKDTIKVRGETNLHSDLLSPPQGKRPDKSPKDKSQDRLSFEMSVPIPVENVMKSLGESLKFEVVWAPECTAKHRGELIQVGLKNATRAELLTAVAEAAKLQFADDGSRVLIKPKSPTAPK